MIDKVDEVSILQSVIQVLGTLEVRADHSANSVDRRVRTSVLVRLCVPCLLPVRARDVSRPLAVREQDPGCGVLRHPLDRVVREVAELLMEVQKRPAVRFRVEIVRRVVAGQDLPGHVARRQLIASYRLVCTYSTL